MFGTPHGTDLAALCRSHGVPHRRVTTLAGIPDAIARSGQPGTRVVEVPVDRVARRAAHARAAAAVRAETAVPSASGPPRPVT